MTIDHLDLRARLLAYLHCNGWVAPAKLGHVGGVWRHPDTDDLLPIPNVIIAAGPDWQVITERLARRTGTSPAAITTLIAAHNGHDDTTAAGIDSATELHPQRRATAELGALTGDTLDA